MLISQRLYYVAYHWGRIFSAFLAGTVVAGLVVVIDVPVSIAYVLLKSLIAAGLVIVLIWILDIRYRQVLSGGLFARVRGNSEN
jgi:urea transporter